MTFLESLSGRGYQQLFLGMTFVKHMPLGAKQFGTWIKQSVESKQKIYIDPDCDPDGYFSALNIKTMYDAIGYTNYFIPMHTYKRHTLSVEGLQETLKNEDYDLYFILDSSSNNTALFDLFKQYPQKRLIVIDHHMSTTDRSMLNSNVLLINPQLDKIEKQRDTPLTALSAGAICSLLVDYAVKSAYPNKYDNLRGHHWIYGYITLYSDSCRFTLYNISYARKVSQSNYDNPKIVKLFLTKYNALNREFLSYRMIPRINTLIRGEHFKMVWDLFFNTSEFEDADGIEQIETIYKETKAYVASVVTRCKVVQKEHLVIAELPKDARIRNYTGLIASNLVSQYQLPVMCIMEVSPGVLEGSVRDLYSRNLLSAFKLACQAEGHEPAFGVSLASKDLDNVSYLMNSACGTIETTQEVITIDWSKYSSKDPQLREDISLMAEYNEYAGQGLPSAYGIFTVNSSMSIKRWPKNTDITWGPHKIIAFDKYVAPGATIMVAPTLPGPKMVVKYATYDTI